MQTRFFLNTDICTSSLRLWAIKAMCLSWHLQQMSCPLLLEDFPELWLLFNSPVKRILLKLNRMAEIQTRVQCPAVHSFQWHIKALRKGLGASLSSPKGFETQGHNQGVKLCLILRGIYVWPHCKAILLGLLCLLFKRPDLALK